MTRLLPAEWADQQAVLLTWPRDDGDFGADLPAAETTLLNIASAISCHEAVWISVHRNQDLPGRIADAGGDPARVRCFRAESNDIWVRDHGPITVVEEGALRHLDFNFNGWGGKYPAERDNALTRTLATQQAFSAPVDSEDFVLEGGAIDTDGAGSLLTTEHCLLSPTRNPGWDRGRIESELARLLGTRRVLWLSEGRLEGDDTDGHVDTLARFSDPETIIFQSCDRKRDPHHAALAAMHRELESFRTAAGRAYRLVPLPLPAPVHAADGHRLPAGYANFLVINGAVLVPTYGDAADAVAMARIGAAFPGRQAVAIDCRALVTQYGSLHCATMQVPAPP